MFQSSRIIARASRQVLSTSNNSILCISSKRIYTTAALEERECVLEFLEDTQPGNDAVKGVAVLALNRGKVKNALGKVLIKQMRENLQQLRFEPASRVRCVILKSTVEGTFCAGADLKERATMSQQETAAFVHELRSTFTDIENLPVPTIACIAGPALGGGLEMALACDMRVAEESDKVIIGLPETGLAIIPGAGGTQRLPRIIGVAKAKELAFTARKLSAKDAESIGLINYAVPQGKSFDKALELAKEIVQNGPIAVRMAKIAIQEGMQMDVRTGMLMEQQCYAQIIPTKDRLEGLQAFKEKRKPQYKGEQD